MPAIATANALWRYRNAKVMKCRNLWFTNPPKGALVVPDMVAQRDMDATLIMRQFVPELPEASDSVHGGNLRKKIDLSNFVLQMV